jgi:predicted CXXCH cytochrome family protein
MRYSYNLVMALGLALITLALFPTRSFSEDEVRVFVPESLTDISSSNEGLLGERRNLPMSLLSTSGKKISIVGSIQRPAGVAMVITNNGRSPVTPKIHDGYFHADVLLSLGSNEVDVRWRRGDGPWKDKTLILFRSSKLEGGITSNYPPYIFHTAENEKVCSGCHKMTLSSNEIETGMEKNCLGCHSQLTDNVYVHGPVAVGICTICHDPESTPNKYKVNDNDDVLCYGCHVDRKEIDSKKALLHGPVGAGMCTVCHDPHSSPFEYQLVKAKTELCIVCHQEDYNRWIGRESLHPPFKNGNCIGCHDPHSADYKYNLKAPRADICALCHELPVPGHLHPVGVTPQFTLPDDFPLREDGKTMCLTCHDPHGAIGDKLTRRSGCDGCHPK